MSILSKKEKKNTDVIARNDKGLSIVELIIVIAIMAILMGVAVLSVGMLIGSEAKQASAKTYAQLNDIKTGALSRAGEYMIIRYIDVDSSNASTQKAMAEVGVDKSGFYAEKHISTIQNKDSIKYDYDGQVEYSRISSKKVDIEVDGKQVLSDGSNGARIEFDRRTGILKSVDIVEADGTATAIAAGATVLDTFELSQMTFAAGMRTYKIDFDSETGRFTLVK